VNLDENESITSQSSVVDRKTKEKVIYNVILLKISLYKKGENVSKKKKGKKRNNKSNNKTKGKTVPLRIENKFVRYKSASLRMKIRRSKCSCLFLVKFLKLQFRFFFCNLKIIFLPNSYQLNVCHPKLIYPTTISANLTKSSDLFRKTCLILKLLLLRGTVEPNPGPHSVPSPFEKSKLLEIITYNCNGLGEKSKLKRILDKSSFTTNRGGIVMLQETHVMKEEVVKQYCKSPFHLNSFKSNSAGVMTLLGHEFNVLYTHKDEVGRQLYIVAQKGDDKYLVVNVYCPNDHKQSITFIDQVYTKILEIQDTYPDCFVILGGDFNTCITDIDYVNRSKTKQEIALTSLITQFNDICLLKDTFRHLSKDPGFTWNRGTCYSRLDYLFVSEVMVNKLKSSKVDWAYDKSDHAALIINIKLNPEIVKGPGIVKVNPDILDDPTKREQIKSELTFLLKQIPETWNGHMKLDYLKVVIRSTLGKYTGIKRSELAEEIATFEMSLNEIESLKQKNTLSKSKNPIDEVDYHNKITKIDVAKRSIQNNLELSRKSLENTQSFTHAVKWYEYGEKSNKFFLNLNKFRSKQKLISNITDSGKEYIGQVNVMDGIRKFYSNLYKKEDLPENQDTDFFKLCPTLSNKNKDKLDEIISLDEMEKALKSCSESSPGPDGIPYKVYKTFWKEVGYILKESWDYSVKIGELPKSHKESAIVIIP